MAPSNNAKKAILGCLFLGAATVVGGAVYYTFFKKDEVEEELSFTAPPPASASKPAADAPKSKKDAPAAELTALADELLAPDGLDAEGYKVLAEVGLKCKVPDGWEVSCEDGPTPQIAAVKLYPKGLTEEQRMDPSMLGMHPNVMIMIEDTPEPMSSREYKDKSKEMAIRSGQGMMSISGDEDISVGPFEYRLEGSQPIPDPRGMMQIKFVNLLTMNGGCGYALQYIATEDTFADNWDFVMEWASTIKIMDLIPRVPSVLEYTNAAQQMQINVPWAWTLLKENRDLSDGRVLIVSFRSGGSPDKPDVANVYKFTKPAAAAKPEAVLDQYFEAIATETPTSKKVEGAVCSAKYFADSKEVTVCCNSQFALEIVPADKSSSLEASVIDDILATLKSVPADAKSAYKYINKHNRFNFEMTTDCSLAEFKFGTTAAMYSPVPQPEDLETNIPLFKVYVNKEEETYADLKAVEAKLREACEASAPMQDSKIETFQGREWLSFHTTFMDGHWGPFGTREEYKSKVYICLRGSESFMLKWEVAANEWRRYERYLTQLMESFVVGE